MNEKGILAERNRKEKKFSLESKNFEEMSDNIFYRPTKKNLDSDITMDGDLGSSVIMNESAMEEKITKNTSFKN